VSEAGNDHPTGKKEENNIERESGKEAERLLAEQLTQEEPDSPHPEEEALRRLPPRWEIRIQAERDPVAEETAVYRSLAKEVDGRYDDAKKPGEKRP
jgi:hypothetical protein